MHTPGIRAEALRLIALGVNDCEVGRRLDISRTTVRDWREPRYTPRGPGRREACWRCWRPTKPVRFTDASYAHLLGLYLGDWCISKLGRSFSFRLSLDAKYPGILQEAQEALATAFRGNAVGLHFEGLRRTTAVVHVYSNHLPCLFPQHGAGLKHKRRIVLEPWQESIIEREPWLLIRGLIQSDGCRFLNRTGPYVYPSYEFTQVSDDIREIFTSTCDLVEVRYRVNGRRVRIYRRASVALLDQYVGPKR